MDLQNLTLFQMALRRMDHSAQRQVVLSQNIANADTPHYVPRDLSEPDFRDIVSRAARQRIPLAQTSAGHLDTQVTERVDYKAREVREPYEVVPDGNAVVIEEQLLKVNQARGHHTMAVNLMRKHMQLIRMALGNGGG